MIQLKHKMNYSVRFSADKDVSSLLGALRNTVDGQGNPLGYKGAWDRFDKAIVEMRKAGLISAI